MLASIWAGLTLEDDAAAYLEGRGIDPQVAATEGVRSVPRGRWSHMVADHSDAELAAAGIWHPERGYLQPYWHKDTAFLVLPYHDDRGQLASLRYRRIDGDEPKALGLLRVGADDLHCPPLPYLAPGQVVQAVRHDAPLYVVEGEPDALALATVHRHAVAAPGAQSWQDRWCCGWEDLPAVVVLADGDDAGEGLAERVADAAAEELGPSWARDRLHLCAAGEGLDPGDLLEAGELRDALDALERQRGWTSPEIPPWEAAG